MASDSSAPASSLADALREAVDAGLPRAIAELSDLVRIPSVSWDGFDVEHVRRSAARVAELARETGVFDEVDVFDAPIPGTDRRGKPAVLATRAARDGRPTVMLYAHHDVQPEGDPEVWDSEPFEPTLRGDRLYARGAADDKAGVLSHLAAIRALTAASGADLDLGLVLFVEGEEEFGSPSFSAFLDEHRDALSADVIIVADSGNWDLDTPALTVGLRGAVFFNLTVTTLDHASHSGMFGGAVPDAMLAAIRTLDSLWDENGSVAVPGLRSRDAATPDYDEARLRAETGLREGARPVGTGTILSRIWDQPSITVTGIDAPSVRNASNTLVPSVRVRVSARVAPGQSVAEAREALIAHLQANAAFGATLEFGEIEGCEPFLVDASGWAVADALEVMEEAYGTEPVQMGVGGSIPFIAELVEVFPEAQILVTGVEDPDSRAHSPNESLHMPTFRRAILAEALLLSRLDQRSASDAA